MLTVEVILDILSYIMCSVRAEIMRRQIAGRSFELLYLEGASFSGRLFQVQEVFANPAGYIERDKRQVHVGNVFIIEALREAHKMFW